MHSALSVLLTLSLSISSSTAYTIPTLQSPIPAKKAYTPSLGTSCTFTLFHKQLCPGGTPASTKANYIQINTIHDHFNNMTIDIAALRPLAAHSSYVRVSEDRGLAIKNLRDGRHLTVKGSDESDDVAFEYAGVSWSTEEWKVSEGVGCMASAWSVESEQWACGLGSRERMMECAIPCGPIVEQEENDEPCGMVHELEIEDEEEDLNSELR